MSVHTGDQRVEGYFAGLGDDGALLLADADGDVKRFTFGDITLTK